MSVDSELDRIKQEYSTRDRTVRSGGWRSNIYHPRHPIGQLQYEQRFEVLVDAINTVDLSLETARVLDFGCGAGSWLRLLVELGAVPGNLVGMDLSEGRIAEARASNPAIQWTLVAGETIPAPDAAFDLAMQSSVFSSILDEQLAQRLAAELRRVVKPGGLLLFSDLLISSPGRLTAYPIERVRALFAGWSLRYKRGAFPLYFRRLYQYPWLCRLLSQVSGADAEFLIVMLEKPLR